MPFRTPTSYETDDEWKREFCGNCEFRVTSHRDPRLAELGPDVGFCRAHPLQPVMTPRGPELGYNPVAQGNYACANFLRAKVRPPAIMFAAVLPTTVN